MGVVSYGSECPSHGVYARVTKVKHWILFLTQEAEDSNCNKQIPLLQGNINWRNDHNNNLLVYSQDSSYQEATVMTVMASHRRGVAPR